MSNRFLKIFFTFSSLALAGLPAASQPSAQYQLTGVTVYNSDDLLTFATQLVAQRTGAVRAPDVAAILEQLYREDGYFLAEVFVASDGRTLIVDEGEIGELVIEGVDARTFRLIRSYMEPAVGQRPARQDTFERSVMLVEDIGSISALAEIDYPPGSDTARVRIVAEEEKKSQGYITFDHPARAFGDAGTITIGQQFIGAFAPGDLLRFEMSGTSDYDGRDESAWGALTYRAPVGGAGAYGEAYIGGVTARRNARGTLATTDIEGNTAILALGFPFVRDVETFGYGLLEIRRSESDVDVAGLSFESEVSVIGASWIYSKTVPNGGAYEYAVNLSFGQRENGVLVFDDGDKNFFHLRAGLGMERPVSWFGPHSTFRAELWGQYSPDRLPGIEEFYIGGNDEDRGYVFAEARGDSGLSAMIEVGRDLFPASESAVKRVRPFGFIDVGLVQNNKPSAAELKDEAFASLGLGLDAEFDRGLFARSYVAVPLADGPRTQAGDPAFYLGLTKTW